jgi:RNA polymerase sigma factor for flagellar operon FliA
MRSARRGVALLLRPERMEAALWRAYREQGDDAARQKLFDRYQPFARKLAGAQFARRAVGGFERSDIEQLAYEALLQAIPRFDPARAIPFESYARRRILGHIGDGLATMSEAAAQYRYRQRAERDRLRSLREAGADEDALAALSRLAATLALGLMAEEVASLDPETVPDGQPSAYESLAWHEMRQKLRQQIAALPERERYVIGQHYRNGVSFQQIAAILGISKGRVSQIHRAALLRLREQLARFR